MSSTRIYFVSFSGTGTDEDPFTPALENHIGQYVKTSRILGGVDVMWMMANVRAVSHADMLTDPGMLVLPDLAPGTLISNVSSDDHVIIAAALSQHELPATVLTSAETLRDVVRGIGEHLIGQAWDPTNFLSI